MHYTFAYAAHRREDEELAAFDRAIDEIGYARTDELYEKLVPIVHSKAGTRAQRYRAASIACALYGVTCAKAARGFIRTISSTCLA